MAYAELFGERFACHVGQRSVTTTHAVHVYTGEGKQVAEVYLQWMCQAGVSLYTLALRFACSTNMFEGGKKNTAIKSYYR